jgi:Uma2 family endonuclease
MTAEQLAALPDDGQRHELVRGELRTMAPAGEQHGSLTALLTSSLVQATRASVRWRVLSGDPGFRISSNPDTVRAPDVALVPRDPRHPEPAPGFLSGPPVIAIEVISPSDLYADVTEKVAEWLEAGCAVVFVANPRARTVSEHRPGSDVRILSGNQVMEARDIIPEWSLIVDELFAQS